MKVLVIPDCHLKPWMFAQADTIMKKGIADKAVCLMDLADDFGVHDDAQYLETYETAIAFAKEHPDTLWCYGNHDLSYIWGKPETGFLQGYNSIAMQLYGEEYQSYKIGFGKEGVCCPVFLCGQQIAQINKSAVVKDNLDEYLIYAVNEKALMPSVMFAIYIDGIYYANRGVYVDDATTINCEYSLNEEVLSHYDPNFVKGL